MKLEHTVVRHWALSDQGHQGHSAPLKVLSIYHNKKLSSPTSKLWNKLGSCD